MRVEQPNRMGSKMKISQQIPLTVKSRIGKEDILKRLEEFTSGNISGLEQLAMTTKEPFGHKKSVVVNTREYTMGSKMSNKGQSSSIIESYSTNKTKLQGNNVSDIQMLMNSSSVLGY